MQDIFLKIIKSTQEFHQKKIDIDNVITKCQINNKKSIFYKYMISNNEMIIKLCPNNYIQYQYSLYKLRFYLCIIILNKRYCRLLSTIRGD